MDEIFIITAYQFDVTDKLIKLLGRHRCFLVVDNRSVEEYSKFTKSYGDIIISSGAFGYYTIDEAYGRLIMIHELLKRLNGPFKWMHVISQNDLPTMGFFNRQNILIPGNTYVHIHKDGWMSNYMSLDMNACIYLDSHFEECRDKLVRRFLSGYYNSDKVVGAPSELLWSDLMKDYPGRVNTDLRMYTYPDDYILGIKGKKIGIFTKATSPVTLKDSPECKEVLLNDKYYIFARKFDPNSPIYAWMYNTLVSKMNLDIAFIGL